MKPRKTYFSKVISLGMAGIFIPFLIYSSWYFYDRFSYAKPLPLYNISKEKNAQITIGIIGDSWVFDKRLDSLLCNDLFKSSVNARILSSGHPGAKTKIIYQNLFVEKGSPNSSKFIIESNPDYCIVVTGVNDAIAQLDVQNYSHHVQEIIKTLLHYKIKPVVVSMPAFGVEETINALDYLPKTRNIFTGRYNNANGELNSIEGYTNALIQDLEASRLKDSILFINFHAVTAGFDKNPEYYINPSHLNTKGNQQLCKVISEAIIRSRQLHF
jgi:hypothetical protein